MSNGSFSQAGFYYQNNVAALKILGLLDLSTELLNVALENYDKGKHIDDIIITKKESIEFYQVKWSADTTNVYTIHNLIYKDSEGTDKSLWKKLADGYSSKITDGKPAIIILYSPREASNTRLPSKGINKSLKELIAFQNAFKKASDTSLEEIEKHDEFKVVLHKLEEESGLTHIEFIDFFKTLHFGLEAPELEYIKLQLQNKADQLGLDATQIIKLLDLVVNWSISGIVITKDKLLSELGIRDRFVDRLSQVFKVEESNYIENTDLFQKLDILLNSINNGYIFVEAVPGAGKSTALTKYASQNKQVRFSYYCFIPDDTTTKEYRLKAEYFLKSFCIAIEKTFSDINLPIPYSENYEEKLSLYFEKLSSIGEKIIFLIDGLDHVDRNRDFLTNPLTNNLFSSLPENLIIILTSQYIEALPPMVKAQIVADSNRYIKLSRFSEAQVREYLQKKSLSLRDEQVTLLMEKSEGIPLYLRYITSLLEDGEYTEFDEIINGFPKLVDSKINTYHALLFQKIEKDTLALWLLSLLANRKEYTSIEVLKKILKIANVVCDTLQLNQSLKAFKHLLKEKDGEYYTIFHNSFREFILLNSETIKVEINLALVKYYEEDIFQEEAFRNYFSHLFNLGKFEIITNSVNDDWINEAWKSYKPISEIIGNVNIAWNACIQVGSVSQFVRIAFLKHQLGVANFNLESGNFNDSLFFLDAGLNKESLRTIWDGEFPTISNENFFNFYVIKYLEETRSLIPLPIAKQFFSTFLAKATAERDARSLNEDRNDFGAYFKARSLYISPEELLEELILLISHIKTEDIKSLIQFLREKNKLSHIVTLWEHSNDTPLKHYTLSELLLGLYENNSSDISLYQDKFSLDDLLQDEKINFLEKLLIYLPQNEFITRHGNINFEPFFHQDIISSEYTYDLKPEFMRLLQELKLYYFLKPENYAKFEVKISTLSEYPRNLYYAISSCAKLWVDQRRGENKVPSISECKKIIDNLTVPQHLASRIISEHGPKSFIQFHIHSIYRLIFTCLNEICTEVEIKELVPYWVTKHDLNGFVDYRSDIAFAEIIILGEGFRDEVYSLLKHSEILARQDHGTNTLVDRLSDVGRAYGKARFLEEYNRIYRELLIFACGVSYRKDYQFANIFPVLESAHSVNPASTLKRLADIYYLLFKIKDAGNSRMFHICLSSLIGFTIKYYPQLAFELLVKDDLFLGRDETLDIVFDEVIPGCTDAQVPFIWSMIKTLNKWEGFGSENDNHSLSLCTLFFRRLITYPDTEFLKECYLHLYRQFTVEQHMPSKILKINKLLGESGISYDFIETPALPLKASQKSSISPDSLLEKTHKFKRIIPKLNIGQLVLLVEEDFDLVNKYILDHREVNVYNRLRPLSIDLYSQSIGLLKDWFLDLTIGLKSMVEKAGFKCKRLFLEMIKNIAVQRNFKNQSIFESFNALIESIQKQLPGTFLTEYIEKNIKLSTLLKPIYQSSINDKFNAEYILPEPDLIEVISKSQFHHVTKWEDLILKYFEKPVLVRAFLHLSKKVFAYDNDLARSFLEKAFKVSASISFRSEDWETELLDWAYICYPEKANYFVLHNFYAEFVDRESELLYNLSKKVIPWQEHFNDPTFFETYYLSNYQYNIKLAEGLPEAGIDTSFIVNHKETLDFERITLEYLVDLFDYPVVKIRHLALESLYSLYKYSQGLISEFALNKLAGKSSNQIEHFLLLLHALSINHQVEIGDLINKMGWIFKTGHYNIQESYVDLVNYHLTKGTIIKDDLQDTAASIHKKPAFPHPAIVRPLLSRRYFTISTYQNELIEELNQSENNDNNFSDELYTILTEAGYDIIASRTKEAQVHRHFNINTNFDNLEINGPGFQTIQDKINRLFFKHIQQGFFDNKDIRELKYEFRIYDPTDSHTLIVSRPDYVFWKGKETTEKQFIAFSDIDELLDGFTSRQNDNISVFEKAYQRIDKYPDHFTQYFQVEAFLVDRNTTKQKIQTELSDFNAYVSHDNLYRFEIEDFFSKIDNKFRIGSVIYPLVAVSRKYFRHNPECALAIPLSHFINHFRLTQVPGSLNYLNNNGLKVVEFSEWQDQFKDHDRRRFEPLSQGCTLNFNKSVLKEYITERKLDLYINLSLRRSVDKYIPESEMDWVEHSFIKKIDL